MDINILINNFDRSGSGSFFWPDNQFQTYVIVRALMSRVLARYFSGVISDILPLSRYLTPQLHTHPQGPGNRGGRGPRHYAMKPSVILKQKNPKFSKLPG